MALIVTEHAAKLGRPQVAMQPDSGGANGLTVDGTAVYTIVGSGAGPAWTDFTRSRRSAISNSNSCSLRSS